MLSSLIVAAGCGRSLPVPGDQADAASPPVVSSVREPEPAADSGSEPAPPFRFESVAPEYSGITFRHVSGNSADKPFPAADGSGVGAFDFDSDGLTDVYFATGRRFPLDDGSDEGRNQLYRNLSGWRFQNVSRDAGLDPAAYSAGVATGDFDADGFEDVFVTCFGANRLYQNQGDGTFGEVFLPPSGSFSTSAAFLDFDADGHLDLYVGNYGLWSWEENPFCGDRARSVRIFCSPKSLPPEPDVLLHNDGNGGFEDVTADCGIDLQRGRAQGVLATDVDGDGGTDLYIGNDIHPNFLFLNAGGGQFVDQTELTGAAYDRNGGMQAGMGVAGSDVNRDGLLDLMVTNFEGEYHTLYHQVAPGDFHDVSVTHGLAGDSTPWVGWGLAFVDFDLDGWQDLMITNGHVDDNLDQLGRNSPYNQPGLVWWNDQGQFRHISEAAGSYFRTPHPGRGLAVADFDNDLDSDVVITHQDSLPAMLQTQQTRQSRSVVSLRLIGRHSNRSAVGATIRVRGVSPPLSFCVSSGGNYLSGSDRRILIPVDGAAPVDFEILWPAGRATRLSGVLPGREWLTIEPDDETAAGIFAAPAHRSFERRNSE